MSLKVTSSPYLPNAPANNLIGLFGAFNALCMTLKDYFRVLASRVNLALPSDGSEPMTGPLVLPTYLKAALPLAATYINGLIIVSDEIGGLTPAFSDGTNWRRVADRVIVS
jgi:hypothetical protein